MKTQLENIIELAALLVIEGKATEDNALQMAIEEDNKRCLNMIEDINNLNEENTNKTGYEIVMENVYSKLTE